MVLLVFGHHLARHLDDGHLLALLRQVGGGLAAAQATADDEHSVADRLAPVVQLHGVEHVRRGRHRGLWAS